MIVTALVVQFSTYLSPDLGWHLSIAKGILKGKQIYIDFFEVNTPLIIYITQLSVKLSEVFHIDIVTGLNIFNFAIVTVSFIICGDIINKKSDNQLLLLFVTFALFIMPLSYPMSEFGQKEHIFMACYLPYLLEFLLKIKPRIWIFLIACFGILIKPFFIILYLGIFIVKIVEKDKNLLRELGILAAINSAFYLWLWIKHTAYFDTIVPIAFDGYKDLNLNDDTFGSALYNFYIISIYTINFLIAPLLLSFFTFTKNSMRILPTLFMGFIMIYIQGKNFWYHYIPAVITMVLMFGMLTIECIRSWRFLKVVNVIMIMWCLFNTAYTLKINYKNSDNLFKNKYFEIINVIKRYEGQQVLILSQELGYIFPEAIYSKLKFDMKEHTMQILDGVFKYPDLVHKKQKALDYVINDVVMALEMKPGIVFVRMPSKELIESKWSSAFFFKAGYNYIDFFSQNNKFKELWGLYRLTGDAGSDGNKFEIYELKEGL